MGKKRLEEELNTELRIFRLRCINHGVIGIWIGHTIVLMNLVMDINRNGDWTLHCRIIGMKSCGEKLQNWKNQRLMHWININGVIHSREEQSTNTCQNRFDIYFGDCSCYKWPNFQYSNKSPYNLLDG